MARKLVLLVEDNADEAALAQAAFARSGLEHDLLVVTDGEAAVTHVLDGGGGVPLPSLVLLDLKLPGIDGFEVLRRVRADARAALIPIVVFTSSVELHDLVTSYRLGANSYVRKPIDFGELVQITRAVTRYWLTLNATSDEAEEP